MIIGMSPLPFACGCCGHPVFSAIGPFLFDPDCPGHYQPLILVGHWPPSCPVWPCAGCSRQALGPVSSESPCPLGGHIGALVSLGGSDVPHGFCQSYLNNHCALHFYDFIFDLAHSLFYYF